MLIVSESLKSINAYPIPQETIKEIAERRGIYVSSEITQEDRRFKLAKADVLLWLSLAPNVSQDGISYSFTDEDKRNFRIQARDMYNDCGEEFPKPSYIFRSIKV